MKTLVLLSLFVVGVLGVTAAFGMPTDKPKEFGADPTEKPPKPQEGQDQRGIEEMWSTFKRSHGKTYKDEDEDIKRRGIYQSNLVKIKEHNERAERGEFTYTLGENEFADLTTEEFREKFLGDLSDQERDPNMPTERLPHIPEHELPTAVDWKNKMTSVKNQGSCGSCYTFAPAAVLEGTVAIKGGGVTSLSTQQILDCGEYGCNGGYRRQVYNEIYQKGGIMTWAKYPYTGSKGTCKYNAADRTRARIDILYVIDNSETDLVTGLTHYGPVSAGVDASNWHLYHSGIFNGACTSGRNHAIAVAGYGSDYYLIKNSWGTSWGESGYMKLARTGNNYCYIAQMSELPGIHLA